MKVIPETCGGTTFDIYVFILEPIIFVRNI
jgi:hypothetical protein